MSERGSFVTEYIYCEKCLAVVKRVLLRNSKHLRGTMVPIWGVTGAGYLPIVAGKIGGLYGGEELVTFEHELVPDIAAEVCHKIRIAVIAEEGERIFIVTPGGSDA